MPLFTPVACGPSSSAPAGRRPYTGSWGADKHVDVTLTRINTINTAHASNSSRNARGTVALSGWVAFHYWVLATGTTTSMYLGIAKAAESLTQYPGGSADSYGIFCQNGKLTLNSVESVLFGGSYTVGDYITVDYKNGSVYFAKNGVYPLSADPLTDANPHITGLVDGEWYPFGCSADRAESCQILPYAL